MLSRLQVESCEFFDIYFTEFEIVLALTFVCGAGRGLGLL